MNPANPLRGEFAATLAGEEIRFDTTLATVAAIEEHCGGVAIVEAINRAVFGRRAADQMALIAGALAGLGRADAEALAARTAAVEGEAFVLALMSALGFEIVRRPAEPEDAHPFAPMPARAGASDGPAGAPSRSAP